MIDAPAAFKIVAVVVGAFSVILLWVAYRRGEGSREFHIGQWLLLGSLVSSVVCTSIDAWSETASIVAAIVGLCLAIAAGWVMVRVARSGNTTHS